MDICKSFINFNFEIHSQKKTCFVVLYRPFQGSLKLKALLLALCQNDLGKGSLHHLFLYFVIVIFSYTFFIPTPFPFSRDREAHPTSVLPNAVAGHAFSG